MSLIDMNNTTFNEVKNNIKEIFKDYSTYKDYILYLQYYYDKKKPIGLIYGWYKDNYLYIDTIIVDEKQRRKGIAKKMLLNALEEASQKQEIDYIIIELVKTENKYKLLNYLLSIHFIPIMELILKNRCILYKKLK